MMVLQKVLGPFKEEETYTAPASATISILQKRKKKKNFQEAYAQYLWHVSDRGARDSWLVLVWPLPKNCDQARVRLDPADHGAQQRRFPAAARAQQSKTITHTRQAIYFN